jgi:hypothetical protein
VKTVINVDATYTLCLGRDVDFKVGKSSHGMAKNIRDLGLDELKPFCLMSSDNFRSRLNRGMAIAPWKTPELPYPPGKERS